MSLFDHEKPPRNVSETSRETYERVVRPDLGRMQARVLRALSAYVERKGEAPTSAELLSWMQGFEPTLDVNDVRPRLTDLKKLDYVHVAGLRPCRTKPEGARKVNVETFRVSERGEMFLKSLGEKK
jgi:hypothetical protein